MSSKELKHKELLKSQMNAGENQNKENSSEDTQLIERENIKNTPFIVVGNEEKGYILTLGKFKLTENMPTKEEAIALLYTDKWHIILRMITTIHETIMMKIGEELLQEQEKLSTNVETTPHN